MQKRSKAALALATVVLLPLATASATAPDMDDALPEWLVGAPPYPIAAGEQVTEFTDELIADLVTFKQDFQWDQLFADYGCSAEDIVVGGDATMSMTIDCTGSGRELDDMGLLPGLAASAAQGDESALSFFNSTTPAGDVTSALADVTPLAGGHACGNTGGRRHCLTLTTSPAVASSAIRTLSGSSTGVNRLGLVGFGNPCGDGAHMANSVTLTISTNIISYVEAPNYIDSQFSSKWTPTSGAFSRFCADL